MRVIFSWYWNIKVALENSYFKRKYSNLTPMIYYDRKYQVYVNPKLIDERGCAEYVCSESVCDSLIYSYIIDRVNTHAHTISEVFLDAYNTSETFLISDEYREQYSKQEFDLICKLVNQGKIDRGQNKP